MKFVTALVAATSVLMAADAPTPRKGAVDRIKIRSQALTGNLIGDSPERDVSIYLPPSYAKERKRHYPVVYMLHGFTDSVDKWWHNPKHWINLPTVLDKTSAEIIVVMPDAYNAFHGSMYSSSVTIGDWETFVASELVAEIDRRYRTIARRDARGLAGHSMGGYGTMRIGMKRPDVFSSLYLLSPCCMSPGNFANTAKAKDAVKEVADVAKTDFGTKALLASAAAWAPNPKNPPLFIDYPETPQIQAKWAANAPLAMLDQYLPAIKKLKALAFDAGDEDRGIAAMIKELDRRLNDYGVAHTYEEYKGNHINRIAERIETKAMPFFTQNLATK